MRAASITNFSFPGLSNEMLLLHLDLAGVDVSNGAACTSGTVEPSHVLRALGKSEELATSALRFSVGKETTVSEIDDALDILERTVGKLRAETILSHRSSRV